MGKGEGVEGSRRRGKEIVGGRGEGRRESAEKSGGRGGKVGKRGGRGGGGGGGV